MPSKMGFPTLTSDGSLDQKTNKQTTMNNRRLPIAAVFHYLRPVEKDS